MMDDVELESVMTDLNFFLLQQHKLAVKEAKREKRKEKMPKHLKKKLVSSTSRRTKK